MEQIAALLLEHGTLGIFCAILLVGYVKRDRAYIDIYGQYIRHLAEDSADKKVLATELNRTIHELHESCAHCTYRQFVERLGNGGGQDES